ncbi:MAG: hypothetical protein Q4E62_09420, partial [Sutterellaceae bacterium]|nr:hypothetical protein [Sutterellaceae bacterium]
TVDGAKGGKRGKGLHFEKYSYSKKLEIKHRPDDNNRKAKNGNPIFYRIRPSRICEKIAQAPYL